ncbi:MAG: hypothetical protein U0802_23095 [Candidatus Binatia bacterium]
MLTLDDPGHRGGDEPPPGLLATMTSEDWLLELFHAVRGRFDRRIVARHDPDRLYRTHGEPRD